MSKTTSASGGPGVALLFEDAELSAHLRKALVEAGARIVHEGPATKATREDLAGHGADVVVVNLDDKVEECLDTLYDIFDESRQRVVFNDAEASSGLSGWDQARWARHLAAKLLDAHDVDPPRPEEARPVESHPMELMLPDGDMPEAPPAESEDSGASDIGADTGAMSDSGDLSLELEALLAEDGDLLSHAQGVEASSSHAEMDLTLDVEDMSDTDQDAISAIPDANAPEIADMGSPTTEAEGAQPATDGDTPAGGDRAVDEDSQFEETLRMFDQALAESEPVDAGEEGMSSSGDALFLLDETAEASNPTASEQEETTDDDDFDAPAPTPLKDKALESKGSPYSLVDQDDDTPLDTSVEKEKSTKPPEAPDWDLVDFDTVSDTEESVEMMQQDTTSEPIADPSEFGIEKVGASEYLAPEGEGSAEAADIEPTFSLELEPIEQAVAPKMIDESMIKPADFDTSIDSGVRSAVILAAGSSPESRQSLRDFIAALAQVPQAVMIGIIHQQVGDDLQAIAAELQSVNPQLPVRVADGSGKARHGELILVPAGKQAALETRGHLELMDSAEQPLANPSIDLTMTLVAQELGNHVLAIVLAGDAIDALAGAQAVNDSGGRVWALDPADCNDNTMVSVICEEQLAERTGTPMDLAARMLEELS